MRCWTMRWQSWRLSRRACRPCRQSGQRGSPGPQEGQPERFKAKLRDQYLEGKGVDASQALADAMGSIQEAQEANSAPRTWMLNHTLQPLEVSAWPDDLRQALERGLFCSECWGTSRRSTSPTSRGSERHRTRGTRRRCWKRCPIWRHRPLQRCHWPRGGPANATDLDLEEGKLSLLLWAMKRRQGELRMFGGIWKKHSSGRARTSNSSSRRRSSWPWSAGPTHSRVSGTTSTRSSTRPWRSERR